MILTAEFESTEAIPPAVWAQCRKALVHVLDSYGFNVAIRENRSSELDAYQRFFAWRAADILNRCLAFPATPPDAEVK